MSDHNREVEELKTKIWRYVSDSTRYSIGSYQIQRLVELDPEGASALAAEYQSLYENYKDEVNRYAHRMLRKELDDYRRSIDAAEGVINDLIRYGAAPPNGA